MAVERQASTGLSLDNKQWGASGYAVTFPIAFNVVYNVLSIPQTTASTSNAYWGRFYITALTKNGFNVSDTGAGSNRWIAIGSAQQQWGKYTNSGNDRVITYPIAFSELYYANVISPDNCETFVYGISNTNINYRLCNGYNDDRWNGTQTSRLFAVGR